LNAEQLFTRRRSATVYPASCIVHPASSAVDFQRSNVQTCKRSNASTLQPANLPFFHSSIVELFLEKTFLEFFYSKIPPPSPASHLRSVSQLSTVHGQWSIVNLQSSTFNFQPIAFDPRKRNSKKQTQIKSRTPAYTPSPHHTPTYTALARNTARIE
jgi:hypothetical protein